MRVQRGVRDFVEVKPDTAKAFMAAEEMRGVAPKTWNDILKLLRATFKHLHPHLNDGSNPFHGIVTKATETVNREPFTVEELKAITEVCADAHQGWRSPVVVSKRSGFIVAGHGRYEAAKVLGVTKVPVDYQDFPTEADEWAHLVADNRLAELAETDEAALKAVLGELKAGDFDLDLAGFDAAALEGLLAEPAEPAPPLDFPEVNENVPTEFQCPRCQFKWSGKPS